jgi:hypothetical protein
MEILDVVCGETILENRGIVADIESKKQDTHKNVDNDLIKELLATDLSAAKYTVIKSLFLRLGLQSKSMSDAVIRPMLIQHKANLQPAPKPTESDEEANNEQPQTQESNTPGDEPNQGANGMPKVDVEDTEKKKEEQQGQE